MPKPKSPKVEVTDLSDPDIFAVDNKEPGMYYRHAANEPMAVQRWKKRGFQVVTGVNKANEEPGSPAAVVDSADSGFVNIPEHVLMKCPEKVNTARVKRNQERFEAIKKQEDNELEKAAAAIRTLKGRFGKLDRLRDMIDE